MPIISSDAILLPSYANVEGAHQSETPLGSKPGATGLAYTVGANNFEVLTVLSCQFLTDATAGNRRVQVSVTDPDGHTVYNVGTVSPQAPSGATFYNWAPNLAPGQTSTTAGQWGPIPSMLLYPSWQVLMFAAGLGAGDVWQFGYVVSLKIPTGTPASELAARTAPAKV